jgi:hypothetical protein
LAKAIGGNLAAKRLGILDSSVRFDATKAHLQARADSTGATAVKRLSIELEAEVNLLCRELANAKLDLVRNSFSQ